jgi:hypothetical protein
MARGPLLGCFPLMALAARRQLLEADHRRQLRDRVEELSLMLSGLINGLDPR